MKPLYRRLLRNLKNPVRLVSWLAYQLSRRNNYFFVSMPCSGTHWLRFMLAKSLVEYYDLDYEFHDIKAREIIPSFRTKTDRFQYNHRREIPRIQHSHDLYSPLYYNRDVILLLRNLRDSLVSHYERYTTWHDPNIGFPDFVRENGISQYDVKSLSWRVSFFNSWGENTESLASFEVVKYEQLKDNTTRTLQAVLESIDLGEVESSFLESVVEFASKEHMSQLEQASEENQQGTPKVNKAKTGRHEEYFTEDVERYLREYLDEKLEYDFDYGYTT